MLHPLEFKKVQRVPSSVGLSIRSRALCYLSPWFNYYQEPYPRSVFRISGSVGFRVPPTLKPPCLVFKCSIDRWRKQVSLLILPQVPYLSMLAHDKAMPVCRVLAICLGWSFHCNTPEHEGQN